MLFIFAQKVRNRLQFLLDNLRVVNEGCLIFIACCYRGDLKKGFPREILVVSALLMALVDHTEEIADDI